jgi:hypothetical protein
VSGIRFRVSGSEKYSLSVSKSQSQLPGDENPVVLRHLTPET